jgi:hypothetical protein
VPFAGADAFRRTGKSPAGLAMARRRCYTDIGPRGKALPAVWAWGGLVSAKDFSVGAVGLANRGNM